MHIPLTPLILFPLTVSALVSDPNIFARKKGSDWCRVRGIDRYIKNVPNSASSSIKSWCASQTVVANGTANFFATRTVRREKGEKTKTRTTKTETKTKTKYSRTKTVTAHRKRSTKTSATTSTTTPALAARATHDPNEPVGGNPIKRSEHFPGLGYSKGTNKNRGTPANWTNLPDQMIQVLCDCLDSPWKTKNGTWTRTNRYTRTWTKTGTKTGGTVTVDVDGTTTKTVDGGEATVTVED
ncbi:hypothetical protein TWF281_011766 [Arthrobotrys megalospora]